MVFEDTPASRRRHARSHMYPQAQRAHGTGAPEGKKRENKNSWSQPLEKEF